MHIHGFKKQKGGGQKPHIAPDDLVSVSYANIMYGLAEGEIFGLADGGKSIRLDGTPLINDNGQPNFNNVNWEFRTGTLDQTHIAGFPAVENETNVGVELRHDRPWVKAINNRELSAVRVRLNFNALRHQHDNGDIGGYAISYAIDVQTDGGSFIEVLTDTVRGKASQGYKKSHRIDLPNAGTAKRWTIRVRRITPNRNSDLIADTVHIDALTEIIDAKLAYPCTALLGLSYDAKTFANIAKLAVRLKGKIIQVPTNYNPETRTYTGLWDGTFKPAYSNNPAWVFYDICTHKRYGLGERLAGMVDKWRLYQIGQYCDELVDDGKGGQEPRFTCNVYIQKADDAYRVLQNLASVFRGLSFWDGANIIVDSDTPKEPVYTFSPANVVGGEFAYTGTRARDRRNLAKVAWDNPENGFTTEYELIPDEQAIARYGVKVLDIAAFGCTSQGQAQRAGLWALKAEQLETQTVSFKTGLMGFIPQVGQVINIADNVFAGRAISGKIVKVSTNKRVITLDRVAGKVGDTLTVNGTDGVQSAKITHARTSAKGEWWLTVNQVINAEPEHIWAVISDDLKLKQFRILTIAQNDDATFDITALEYNAQKYTAVDTGAVVVPQPYTVLKATPITAPNSVTLTANTRTVQGQAVTTLNINWEQVTGATAYIVEWRKDDGNWQTLPKVSGQSVDIEGVYAGKYTARVRAVDAFDNESLATSSQLTSIAGKQGKPPRLARLVVKGVLFGMELGWTFNKGSDDTNFTEIQVSPDGRSNIATLGTFAYPTNKHEITGLQGNLTQFYRARIVDKLGNTSDWTAWVSGTTSADADKVLDLISGQINQSHLDQTLRTPIGKIGTLESTINSERTRLSTAINDINSEKQKIAKSIVDIDTLTRSDNAKTQELARLTQTVNGTTSTVKDLMVTTGDLSQRYTQLKTQSDDHQTEIVKINQTAKDAAVASERLTARFDSFAVGGRNYLTKASFGTWQDGTWQDYHFVINDKNLAGARFARAEAIEQGADVVFSFKIAKKSGQITSIGGHTHSLSHHQIYIDGVLVGNDFNAGVAYPDDLAVHHIVIKAKDHFATATSDKSLYIQPNRGSNGYADTYSCEIWDCKLEKGNIATDWTPAPEDLQADIDAKASSASLDEFKRAEARANEALSQRITSLNADYQSNKGATSAKLAQLEKSVSDASGAVVTAQSQLNARFDNLSVGGRNLILKSDVSYSGYHSGSHSAMTVSNDVAGATTLTLSADIEIEGNPNTTYAIENRAGVSTRIVYTDGSTQWFEIWQSVANYKGRMVRTFKVPTGKTVASFNVCNIQTRLQATKVIISKPKLEKGNVATDWTPAPEDIQSEIDAKASSASLDEFKRAEARANEAISSRVTQLSTTVGGQTASIKNVEDSVNGVRAIKAVTVDNNGFISGYGLMSELQNGQVTSRFGINADQIYFGATTSAKKPFVFTTRPTTIDGVSYPAGAWLNSASIANASIKLAHIDKASIGSLSALSANIGTLTTSDSRGTFTYTGSKIELRDPQGRLLMEMGLL